LVVTNLDNLIAYLAGLHLIGAAALDPLWSLLLSLLLTAAGCASVVAPLSIYLIFPAASAGTLAVFEAWIGRASQAVIALALVALGGWLILQGVAGLLA
jgi:hypothetical protein